LAVDNSSSGYAVLFAVQHKRFVHPALDAQSLALEAWKPEIEYEFELEDEYDCVGMKTIVRGPREKICSSPARSPCSLVVPTIVLVLELELFRASSR
jgi:hypothetical protein